MIANPYIRRRVLLAGGTPLNDMSWADIRAVSDAGLGASFWALGDSKKIVLSGKVGGMTFSDLALEAFIIGFDHNGEREGARRVHFQVGLSSGRHAALCDGKYNTTVSGAGWFSMNAAASNAGGWAGSAMRAMLGGTPAAPGSETLMAVLPADLRAVLKPVTKYTDNTGGGTDTAENVTATEEYLFLPSEFEVFGQRTRANSAEQSFQRQYAYYEQGGDKIAYRHDGLSTAAIWWLRSPLATAANGFCAVSVRGAIAFGPANGSRALSPCFAV